MKSHLLKGLALFSTLAMLASCSKPASPEKKKTMVERGRYLITIGNCNDCHTSDFLRTEGKVPESEWLTGDSMGWQGPWGTTYPPNLRLLVSEISEEQWVTKIRTLEVRPPMPWFNLKQMEEGDVRAVYRYLTYLGPKGTKVPKFVPPGEEPETPYLSLAPQNLPPQDQPPMPPIKQTVLLQQDLKDMGDKEVVINLVEIAPGASTPKHFHPGHIFGYILEGKAEVEHDEGKVQVTGPGAVFYEIPNRNMTATNRGKRPIKAIIFMIKDKNQPPTVYTEE